MFRSDLVAASREAGGRGERMVAKFTVIEGHRIWVCDASGEWQPDALSKPDSNTLAALVDLGLLTLAAGVVGEYLLYPAIASVLGVLN